MSHDHLSLLPTPEPRLESLHQADPLYLAFAAPDILPLCSLTSIAAMPGHGRTTLASLLAAATAASCPDDLPPEEPAILMISHFNDRKFQLRPSLDQLQVNPSPHRLFHKENRATPKPNATPPPNHHPPPTKTTTTQQA